VFCQMGKGKRAQLYNVLGVWWSARRLWRVLPPALPNLCFRERSQVPRPWLRIASPAGSAPSLSRSRLSLKSWTDYCIPPTESLFCRSFLCFRVRKSQKSLLSVQLCSRIWGWAHPILVLGCFGSVSPTCSCLAT